MGYKVLTGFFVLMFLVSLSVAQDSGTGVTFRTEGCDLPGGGGLAFETCSGD